MAIDGDAITVVPTAEPTPRVPLEFSGLNRIPILLLGPLLHRAHEAFVPLVGGDRIGRRPVDFHVSALQQMGAEIEVQPQGITARMAGRLRGTRITLPYPSVGATETVLLSAVLAEGRTVIHNAATEPEVVELALFLQRMGAHIALRPDRRFVIEGVESLTGARAHLQGDRLEAFSYLVAGPDDRRRGARRRVQPGPHGHRHQHAAADGRRLRDHRRVDQRQRRAAAALRRADRHPPRVHDRLAAARSSCS